MHFIDILGFLAYSLTAFLTDTWDIGDLIPERTSIITFILFHFLLITPYKLF